MERIKLLQHIEAYLLFTGDYIKKADLCSLYSIKESDLADIISDLRSSFTNRPLSILENHNQVGIVVKDEFLDSIKETIKNDRSSELSKATNETLSVILYLSPISKLDIDTVRGVDTRGSLKQLQIRGLIKKNKEGFFDPTLELLTHLGVESTSSLPHYFEHREKLQSILKSTYSIEENE